MSLLSTIRKFAYYRLNSNKHLIKLYGKMSSELNEKGKEMKMFIRFIFEINLPFPTMAETYI